MEIETVSEQYYGSDHVIQKKQEENQTAKEVYNSIEDEFHSEFSDSSELLKDTNECSSPRISNLMRLNCPQL